MNSQYAAARVLLMILTPAILLLCLACDSRGDGGVKVSECSAPLVIVPGRSDTITFQSKQYYSQCRVQVKAGEQYSFRVLSEHKLKDLFLPGDAGGIDNGLLKDKKKRVPGLRCFRLCGAIGENEGDVFDIGRHCDRYVVAKDGDLHLFLNDHKNRFFYLNNRGSLTVQVTRIK